ncbi:MAG: DNA topoisomerase III [Candidatus Latescibacteria bacterium]|nr:DNA topoisomerase III [Candidatus Latescibacterota bacterium]
MPKVVLAEKPSVARDIARVLGARTKGNGQLSGNGYIVTWALGHLVHFSEPDDYGPPWKGQWAYAQLPMVPDKWKLKTDRKTSSQYNVVKQLITSPDTTDIICATDAGREGEHIFRLIYQHARCRKPVQRLWISSLTDQAIGQGFRNLQPASQFDDLAQAAHARAQADWLVGLNLTRAYTIRNRVLCTIGRVQTPTLAMIVKRADEIANFKKKFYYELHAHLKEGFLAKYSDKGKTRIDKKEDAEALHKKLSPHKTGTVVSIDKKTKKIRPPQLYDLINLQRDANRRFGLTAADTLKQAQALYETHKLITYPRTESRHISEDMVAQLPGILEKLDHPQAPEALERLRGGHRLSKAYVDKTKLSDHHGIIPTGQAPPANLTSAQRRVYELVVARFVAIFLPDHVVEETTVTLDIGGATFIAKGSRVLEVGWKIVEPRRQSRQKPGAQNKAPGDDTPDNEEEAQALPPLTKGQQVHVDKMEVVEKETQPPKPYTDATLLNAMKYAGRQIDDEALAQAMKESGLGTPATRADMIEKLIRTQLIERQKKALMPTDKGKALISVVAAPLKSPELTGDWEQKLKDIEEGKLNAQNYYQSIVDFITQLIPEISQSPTLPPESRGPARQGSGTPGQELGTCPQCKEGKVVENRKAYGCSRYKEGCPFVIWKTVARKKISAKQAQVLLNGGRIGPLQGFISKAGKKFQAALKLDADFKVVFDFDDQAQSGGTRTGGTATGPISVPRRPSAAAPAAAAPPPASRAPAATTPPPFDDSMTPPPDDQMAPPPSDADFGPPPDDYQAPPPDEQMAPSYAEDSQATAPPRSRPAQSNTPPAPRTGSSSPADQDQSTANPDALTCPKCNQGTIVEGQRGFGCNRYKEGCNFIVWKEIAKKTLTENQVRQLVKKGKTALLKGFISKAGRPFEAYLTLDPTYKVKFEFANNRKGSGGKATQRKRAPRWK